MLVVVPSHVEDRINLVLDVALFDCPEAVSERDVLFQQLLEHYDEHGEIPQFSIAKREGR